MSDFTPGSLELAIHIALHEHAGQRDKAGQPYLLHPLRVMLAQSCPEAMMVAVLHDVVEDGQTTLDDLRRQGFSEEVVTGVDAVSRRKGESYAEFVDRAVRHPLGRPVKRADLEDNMDLRRLSALGPKDHERLDRYVAAWQRLNVDQ